MTATPDPRVEALLVERESCAVRGSLARVAAIDAELARLGAEADTDRPAVVVETAVSAALPETATHPQPRRGRRA